jgi:uncharacterized protein YndB with AHSA1/START domain
MTDTATLDAYGELIEPATLKIQRLLPGSVERCWAYLTESELRRQWLAAGQMEMKVDAPFELVWRNDELNETPSKRPDGFPEEDRMQSRITEVDPGRTLSFAWGKDGEVTFMLKEVGANTLLTIVHRRISDRPNMLGISAGWHMHLDVMAAKLNGRKPDDFWSGWQRLRTEYESRIPA